MGLSNYGSNRYENQIEKVFKDINKLELDLSFFNHTNKNYEYKFTGSPNQKFIFTDKIFKLLKISNSNQINAKVKSDIAYAVQKVYEKIFMKVCKDISSNKFSNNLVLSGGCALNSLANKSLYKSKLFNKIYIPYAPGDAGGSIGSATYVSNIILKQKVSNLYTPFIGPNYTNSYIKKMLQEKIQNNKFKITFEKDINKLLKILAKKIYNNSVVGFFHGKMEFGARALGNRSIIANPCNPKMKDILNLKIKRRESFRPFAPTIMEEHKIKWFNNNLENPYMSSVELINESLRKLIPAVTHIDGTGRVQTVNEKNNKNLYTLIKYFFLLSDVPIVLNTSFNENEPIVMTPNNALSCFLRTKMDCLLLENYLIERK